jgi:CHAD domain-containing protein
MARAVKQAVSAKKSQPLAKVARRALAERIDEFWKALGKAVKRPVPRNVHRVRVAGRRLLAARKFYRDLLPDKQARWLKKQVRRAHHAAGEMRNLDVFTQPRRSSLPIRAQAALSVERRTAFRALVATHKRLKKRFKKRTKSLLSRVGWRGDEPAPPVAEEAKRRLTGIAATFAALAAKTQPTPASLHTLRVAGKRLRYTVELCDDSLPPSRFRQLVRWLERFQDAMGAISDAASVIQLTERLVKFAPPPASRRKSQDPTARERKALKAAIRKYQKLFPRAWFKKLTALLA